MKRTFAIIAIAAVAQLSGGQSKGFPKFAWKHCDQQHPRVCIRAAARIHEQSKETLVDVASCESGLDPKAYNPSGATGLFQFMPSTFASTPYGHRRHGIWSARWSSMAAGWMFKRGRHYEWVCYA